MSNVTFTPNMNLPLPTVGVDPGPDYANNQNAGTTIIDTHDHSAGRGVPVTPNGLNITSDLSFQQNNATQLRSARLFPQAAPLSGATDLGCLYESGVDLYYNDGSGNQVRITQSGAVAGSPGSIANLASPASASYVSANETFVWESAASTPANMDLASLILRNLVANSKGLTLQPPNSMSANYTITLPSLPPGQQIMTLDSSGNMSAPYTVDNSTLTIASNVIEVATGGITATQIASNLNLPGSNVQVNGLNVVTSNTNAAANLAIVRGAVSSTGTILQGEGFTVVHSGTGMFAVTFATAFGDNPIVTLTLLTAGGNTLYGLIPLSAITTGFTASVYNASGAVNENFCFIAIGQRA